MQAVVGSLFTAHLALAPDSIDAILQCADQLQVGGANTILLPVPVCQEANNGQMERPICCSHSSWVATAFIDASS